ncbi:response regulator [Deinococcus lacus]|uniref:Response regulator n=1 Tax=Deinococcus lacus TaxID=392561 RepID=A0ABW1Y9T5_9DEIO
MPNSSKASENKRLLLVDDEPQLRELLGFQLRRSGYEVKAAASGPEALETLREFAPDIIVLDVLMRPWDGFETAARMRPLTGAPILFLSSLSAEMLQQKTAAAALPCTSFLTKPFRFEELRALLSSLL